MGRSRTEPRSVRLAPGSYLLWDRLWANEQCPPLHTLDPQLSHMGLPQVRHSEFPAEPHGPPEDLTCPQSCMGRERVRGRDSEGGRDTSGCCLESGSPLHSSSGGRPRLQSLLSLLPGTFSAFDGLENLKLITHSKCYHQPKNNHSSSTPGSKTPRLQASAAMGIKVRHPAGLPQWKEGMYYGVGVSRQTMKVLE